MALLSFGPADLEERQEEVKDFRADLDLFDSLSAGFSEGFAFNPTTQLKNNLAKSTSVPTMKGAEANELYGLTGTNVAFDEEEDVSEVVAKIRSDRYFEKQYNEGVIAQVRETEGLLSDFTALGGTLAASIVDPIGLGLGVGTSMAVRGMGAYAAGKVMADVASKKTLMEYVARLAPTTDAAFTTSLGIEIAENFAVSAAIDMGISPLGEETTGEFIPTEQRVYNVLAGTIIGSGLGTVARRMELAKARRGANSYLKFHGDRAIQVIEKQNIKNMADVANGKKLNPNYHNEVMDMENFLTRPGQAPYTFTPITQSDILEKRFWAAKRTDVEGFDTVRGSGDGTFIVSDNFNNVSNRVSSIRGEFTGEVFEFKLKEGLKILTEDVWEDSKKVVRAALRNEFDALENTRLRPAFLQNLQKAVNESETLDDLVRVIHEELADYHNIPSVDNLLNKALHNSGFGGYSFRGGSATMPDVNYNGIVIFRPENFIPDYKGRNLLEFGYVDTVKKVGAAGTKRKLKKSVPTFKGKNIVKFDEVDTVKKVGAAGVKYGVRQDKRLIPNNKLLDVVETTEAKFDPKHPDVQEYLKTFKEKQLNELERLNSYKSDVDFNEAALKELDRPKNADAVESPIEDAVSRGEINPDDLGNIKGLKEDSMEVQIARNKEIAKDIINGLKKCHLGE
jgi:hypothetical protein